MTQKTDNLTLTKALYNSLEGKNPAEIIDVFSQVRETIKRKYMTLGSQKTQFSHLRKFFDPELVEKVLPWSAELSPAEYAELLKSQVWSGDARDILGLHILRLSGAENIEWNHSANRNRIAKREFEYIMEIQDSGGLILRAVEELKAVSYIRRIVALCALTGRRSYEIGCTASFEKIDHSTVLFAGQAKGKTRDDLLPYPIPLLSDADTVIDALNKLRNDKPVLIGMDSEYYHQRCAKELRKAAMKYYSEFFKTAELKKHITTHDLRSAYAEIVYSWAENPPIKTNYFRKILGHGDGDTGTAQSYEHFRLAEDL